ncbi:hypothetical protein PTSG_03589 [Salpingoeca rosetta]|uniref:MYND-type domain-containing protein n=1 Tax=Salpingoeca rosetta (strain ATCC 50818 / BSB-021) TaxID=946362 RepID=F2U613_SALR5|nr:uncharacterized protein PTSG_03589 [Salpingoeca rosetta]EGD82954.1 hypothetical protein PTSG_03589 [Salpingoeca rosetta]|eukprot:XP_004995318.1 hypothetical protein PTSG_03589 [Salpingoeca rosetta]
MKLLSQVHVCGGCSGRARSLARCLFDGRVGVWGAAFICSFHLAHHRHRAPDQGFQARPPSTANMNAESTVAPQLSVMLQDSTRCGNPSCKARRPKHKCARCMSICYCSKDCQLSHYPNHKAMCKAIAQQFCVVSPPNTIGYDPKDPEEQAIVQSLQEQAHEETPDGERFFPLIFPHKEMSRCVDAQGEYVGVPVDAETLKDSLTTGGLHPGTLYSLPLFCGVARLAVKSGPQSVPYTPQTATIDAKSTKIGLADLIAWRRSSMRKKNGASVTDMARKATPMDNANLVLELLCLLDKTVFPTLQLLRALRVKGALIVQAEQHELSWQFVHEQDLQDFGREVKHCLDSYDLNSAVVTLTSGECVDPTRQATVLMLTPLHVSQAFHEQQVDPSIVTAVGARRHRLTQSPLLYRLIKRQKEKLSPGSLVDESEA